MYFWPFLKFEWVTWPLLVAPSILALQFHNLLAHSLKILNKNINETDEGCTAAKLCPVHSSVWIMIVTVQDIFPRSFPSPVQWLHLGGVCLAQLGESLLKAQLLLTMRSTTVAWKSIRVNLHEVLLTNRCWLFIFPLFPCEDLQLVQLFISVFFWKLELSFCRLRLFGWPFVSVQDFFPMEGTRGELNLSTNQDVLTSYSLFLLTESHVE